MPRKCTGILYKISILLVLHILSFYSYCQNNSYIPLVDDSAALINLLKVTTNRFESDKASISGENKKYIVEQYKERYDYLKTMYEHKEFITEPNTAGYLRSLLQLIVDKNSLLKPLKPYVLFSKVYWPNAASFGEGTLVFNISLFNRLQNEAEAAFILCHELSHLYLDHGNKAINKYVNTLYSKEFQTELKDIKSAQYQQGQRVKGLVKNLSCNNRRHSRDHELEADSMALALLENTGYDVRASLRVLNLLDSVDIEKYATQLHLAQQMNFADYPFQQRWIRNKAISLGEAMAAVADSSGHEEDDSLKTHPDCSSRIAALKDRVETFYQPSQKTFLLNQPLFDTLIYRFDRERILYCYQREQTGRALFYSLQLFATYPNEAWLATMIGKCYQTLYTAQQHHYLGRCIDLPTTSKERTEYDVFLQYLQNLRLNEMALEGYWFLEQHKSRFLADEDFKKIYATSQTIYATLNKN